MAERRTNHAKIAILVIAPVAAAVALIALRPKEEVSAAVVAKVEVPKPVQAEPEPPPAEVNEEQTEEMRKVLLGMKVEEPKPQAAPRPKRRVQREEVYEEEDYSQPEEEERPGLSDATFRSTIESWRGMRSCVESSKSRVQTTSGALKVSLKIAATGNVLDSRVYDESNEAARNVARCVERHIASLKFPAFAAVEAPPVVKEAKFVF